MCFFCLLILSRRGVRCTATHLLLWHFTVCNFCAWTCTPKPFGNMAHEPAHWIWSGRPCPARTRHFGSWLCHHLSRQLPFLPFLKPKKNKCADSAKAALQGCQFNTEYLKPSLWCFGLSAPCWLGRGLRQRRRHVTHKWMRVTSFEVQHMYMKGVLEAGTNFLQTQSRKLAANETSMLSQRRGRAPQPSVTWGGVSQPGGGVLPTNSDMTP